MHGAPPARRLPMGAVAGPRCGTRQRAAQEMTVTLKTKLSLTLLLAAVLLWLLCVPPSRAPSSAER